MHKLKLKRAHPYKAPAVQVPAEEEVDRYDYTPEEKQAFKKYSALVTAWGYRAGEHGEHTAFEQKLATDPSYYYLTNFSDVVFRNLEQISWAKRAFHGDTVNKLQGVDRVTDHELTDSAYKFMAKFAEEAPEAYSKLEELADFRNYRSIGGTAIIHAARALIDISNNNPMSAYASAAYFCLHAKY